MNTLDIKQLEFNGKTVFAFVHELMVAMMCAKYSDGNYITGQLSNEYAEINNDTINDTIIGFATQVLSILPIDKYFRAAATVAIKRYFIKEDKRTEITKHTIEYMKKENEFQISIGNPQIY